MKLQVRFLLLFVALFAAWSGFAAVIDAAKLIAHRGESFDAPENTLPAYQMAVDRGFGFECDIYRSKDGRLFTFHDNTLNRTTAGANTNRCIDASWEDEISKVNVGGWGKWKGSKFDPTRPALFSEVLDLARDGRWIYVEVKGNDPSWVPTIKEELAKAKKANPKNVLFISFGDKVCAELKRLLPEYRVYWLVNSRKWWQKDNAPYPALEIIAKLRSMGVDGVDIEFRPEVVTAAYVEEIRKAGFQVHVWTIDNPDVALQAFAVGADTLTTNRAKYIHDYEPVFWNERAVQFVYPPAFDFRTIQDALKYQFTAKDAQGGVHVFTNHSPKASLSPIWKKIPENCHVTLTVESLGAKREIAGARSFWRMPEFHEGTYPKAKRGYAEASLMAYDYIFNLPSTRYFLEHGKPDPAYALNAYPSKMHNALIRAMVKYAAIRPDRREEALKLARIAADYLISVSQPADAPLAYFPPTYDKPKAGEPGIGGVGMHGQGKNMLLYPADVGLAYLALYRETNEHKYLLAAERIGNTYLKLQGPDGTCPLKVDEKTAKPVNSNRAFPIGICRFLQELSGFIDDARYGEAVRRGIEFVRKGPMRDWNWEGQFEDVEPSAPYKNLTKHSACDTAIFLLEQDEISDADRAFARKVAEFTEDQFICWQTPCDDAGKGPMDYGADWSMKYRTWHCPAVLEQYECYLPIDASARKAIILYLALWKDTHEAQYLAKARALADAMVNMQSENGRIPTFWTDGNIANPKTDWLNCMCSSAAALAQCAEATSASAEYSGVTVDVSALKPELAFVGEILKTRVGERVKEAAAGEKLSVVYAIDPTLAGERYQVVVKDGKAEIRAGRVRSLLFGTGALLRRAEWKNGSFALAEGTIDQCPVKPLRVAYYARHFYNWYHMASTAELVRYTEDLALWGINAVIAQFPYPAVDVQYAKPGDVERFEKVSHEFGAALAKMDLDYIGHGGNNQAPFNTDPKLKAVPNTDPKRGNNGFNVCPAAPGGLDFLRKQQAGRLRRFADVKSAYLEHWPFDEGGCECEKCTPWGGNGFLKLCAALAADNMKTCPGSKSLLSTWTFHDNEFAMLYDYLAKPESDWIGAILVDSHGDFPKYVLEHKIPRDIPIITFPEISMWGREPWGGFGAVAMPARFERLFRQCEKVVSGFQFYSEGLAEEINKVVVIQLYCDPTSHWQDIVKDYCRYEFPGVDPEKFVTLMTHLEKTQVLPNFDSKSNVMPNVGRGDIPHFDDFEGRCRYCLEEAEKGERLSAELEQMLDPSRRDYWRWRQIRLRTIIDREIFKARSWHTPVTDAAYRELVKMYNAERTYGCVQPPINR